MIWIIGGTSEAVQLEEKILGKPGYIITVATEEGQEFLKGDNVIAGRLNKDEMIEFAKSNLIDTIVDLSHPYAKIVSQNAREVSEELNIKYYRYVRPRTEIEGELIQVSDIAELTKLLSELKGTFLITLGSNSTSELVKVRGDNRFIFRVLPAEKSIRILRENNVEMKDIIAELGPFSYEQNLLTMKEKRVDYLVTKDSGKTGGTDEKLRAAVDAGVKVILLGREDETGASMEEIINLF